MAKRKREPHVPEWWVVDKHKLIDVLEEVQDGHSLDEAIQRLLAESYPTSFNPEDS